VTLLGNIIVERFLHTREEIIVAWRQHVDRVGHYMPRPRERWGVEDVGTFQPVRWRRKVRQ